MDSTPTVEPEPAIQVKVETLAQLFDSFDPFPFRERDLDSDAEEFIVSWARELPRDGPIKILIHVPETEQSGKHASDVESAIQRFFAYRAEMTTRELRELFRIGRISLVIGISVLALCMLAARAAITFFRNNNLGSLLSEGFVILGWVANWKPAEIFFFDWWPIARRRRLYRKLSVARVFVVQG